MTPEAVRSVLWTRTRTRTTAWLRGAKGDTGGACVSACSEAGSRGAGVCVS